MKWEKDGCNWPFNKNSLFIQARPYNWHVQDIGEKDKPIALLIHGTGASTHSWRLLIPYLAKKFRIIAFDLPGHGFTKLFNHHRCSLTNMTQDIIALINHLAIKPHIVIGHSAGAALGMRLALDSLSYTVKLVSINGVLDNYFQGASRLFFPVAAKLLTLNPLTTKLIAQLNKTLDQAQYLYEITGSKIDSEGIDLYRRLLYNPAHLAGTLSMMSQWKLDVLERDLTGIKQNVFFLVGANDKMVSPDAMIKYSQKIDNAKIKVEADLGHLMHEECPKKIAKHIIEFSTNT